MDKKQLLKSYWITLFCLNLILLITIFTNKGILFTEKTGGVIVVVLLSILSMYLFLFQIKVKEFNFPNVSLEEEEDYKIIFHFQKKGKHNFVIPGYEVENIAFKNIGKEIDKISDFKIYLQEEELIKDDIQIVVKLQVLEKDKKGQYKEWFKTVDNKIYDYLQYRELTS